VQTDYPRINQPCPKDTNFAATNLEALFKRGYAHTTEYSFVYKKLKSVVAPRLFDYGGFC
jgi:hypothetical protein